MSTTLIDVDTILSENDQWRKLEEEWGNPIDLDTEEDHVSTKSPAIGTLDLKKSTFNSSFLFKNHQTKIDPQPHKKWIASTVQYHGFQDELKNDETKESSNQFYYCISGEILSAASVEEICDKIDDIFKSIDMLAATTSTMDRNNKYIPDIVNCSISVDGLSFDDTMILSNEISMDGIDKCIEGALERFNSTLAGIDGVDASTADSVTTLVRKFSSVLNTPLNCPRIQRPCCAKFKSLSAYWSNRGFHKSFKDC